VDLYIFPGNNPVNMTDPSGMISPEEAERLAALSQSYNRLGATALGEMYDSLLKLEQRKDATKDEAMVGMLWNNILDFRARIAAERAGVIRGWVAEDADLLGTYYRDTAHDIGVLLDDPGSGTQLERKIWEFETALADDSTERVLAIQEAQWRSSVNVFAQGVSAMALATLALQGPRDIPSANAPARGNPARAKAAIKQSRGALKPGKDLTPDEVAEHLSFDEITTHGDPRGWKFLGEKPGSGLPSKSQGAPDGSKKMMEVWKKANGEEIEVHYFQQADGTVENVKLAPRTK
jgi:hypothetical protein